MNEDYPNIIFIIIDALRARNLSCYGYPILISPNIDMISKEGILFEDSYSCSNCTDASRTTIFSGMYPTSHGILGHGGLWRDKKIGEVDTRKLYDSGILLLPEILRAKGYTTLAVDWLGRWHRRGFDHYSGMLSKTKKIYFPIKK
ncbi:MAG: sulfatase-like hydrolase/transferase, partial [Candidatus Hodarchaeota archaeon]